MILAAAFTIKWKYIDKKDAETNNNGGNNNQPPSTNSAATATLGNAASRNDQEGKDEENPSSKPPPSFNPDYVGPTIPESEVEKLPMALVVEVVPEAS